MLRLRGIYRSPAAERHFDRKDQYNLPTQDWGKPLSEKQIIDVIKRLSQQYKDRLWYVPIQPRALNVVNTKGELLGYIYTGVETEAILMKREMDGRVIVYLPTPRRIDGGGGGR